MKLAEGLMGTSPAQRAKRSLSSKPAVANVPARATPAKSGGRSQSPAGLPPSFLALAPWIRYYVGHAHSHY
jgi:hypothetical protein